MGLSEELIQQGIAALQGADSTAALTCFDRALSHDTTAAAPAYLRAVALARLHRLDESLHAARAVLQQHLGYRPALELIGRLEATFAARGLSPRPAGPGAGPPVEEWRIGQLLLDEFVVERKLGQGGMGAVHLVRSQVTGRPFAVKTARLGGPAAALAGAAGAGDQSHGQVLRELQAWIDLPEHPHLMRLWFFRTVGPHLALFTDVVAGGSLADWIAARRLAGGPGARLDVAIQLAWALAALHGLGLVHQDVKPANVLMTDDSVVRLTDFGLARARSALTAAGGHAFTPAYCSPEQASGRPLDAATDQWSFAVTVLELFIGEIAWSAGPLAGRALAHPELAERLPGPLAGLLERCFDGDPARRWPGMAEVARELQRVHREVTGAPHGRTAPAAVARPQHAADQRPRSSARNLLSWDDPRPLLQRALAARGEAAAGPPGNAGDGGEAAGGSRRAQAVADLAVFRQVRLLLEPLVAAGDQERVPDLARALGGAAAVCVAIDDVPGALALYERTLEVLGTQEAPWARRDRAMVAMNKANALLAIGEYRQATPVFLQTEQYLDALGEEMTLERAQLCNNQGIALAGQGDHVGALAAFARSTELLAARARATEEGPMLDSQAAETLALAWSNGGFALGMLRRHQEAAQYCARAITLLETLQKEEGPSELLAELARSHVTRGLALRNLGEPGPALEEIDAGLALLEQLLAQGRHEAQEPLASGLNDRVLALVDLDRFAEAAATGERAILLHDGLLVKQGRRDVLPELARACMNRAVALERAGQLQAALVLYQRSLTIRERLVGEGRDEALPAVASACEGRGNILLALGDPQAALASHARAVALYEKLVGAGHPELRSRLAGALMALGEGVRQAGEATTAAAPERRALELYRQLRVEEGAPVEEALALGCSIYASVLRDLDDLAGAAALDDEAVALLEPRVAAGHTQLLDDLARAVWGQALTAQRGGQVAVAGERARQVLALIEPLIAGGRRDLDLLQARARLLVGWVLSTSGDLEGAAALLKEAVAVLEPGSLAPDERVMALRQAGDAVAAIGDLGGALELNAREIRLLAKLVEEDLAYSREQLNGHLRRMGLLLRPELLSTPTGAAAAVEVCDRIVVLCRHEEAAIAGDALAVSPFADIIPRVLLNKGAALQNSGDLAGARRAYDESVALFSDLVAGGRADLGGDLALARRYRQGASPVAS